MSNQKYLDPINAAEFIGLDRPTWSWIATRENFIRLSNEEIFKLGYPRNSRLYKIEYLEELKKLFDKGHYDHIINEYKEHRKKITDEVKRKNKEKGLKNRVRAIPNRVQNRQQLFSDKVLDAFEWNYFILYDIRKRSDGLFDVTFKSKHDADEIISIISEEQLKNKIQPYFNGE